MTTDTRIGENIHFWAATDVGRKRDHNEDNFLVDKALMEQKPPRARGVTTASDPPVIIASATPSRINLNASPTE